jgi:hypothetical protein
MGRAGVDRRNGVAAIRSDCHKRAPVAQIGFPDAFAHAAGYSPKNARQSAHQAMKTIQKRTPEIMEELGFDLRSLIDRYLLPALDAQEAMVFNNGGKFVYSKELPAHDIR